MIRSSSKSSHRSVKVETATVWYIAVMYSMLYGLLIGGVKAESATVWFVAVMYSMIVTLKHSVVWSSTWFCSTVTIERKATACLSPVLEKSHLLVRS